MWLSRLLIGLTILLMTGAAVRAQGFDARSYGAWVDARTGTGEPVYWYCIGTLRAYPSGKLLYRVEGIDTARAERLSATSTRQFSRKIFVYRDAETNAVIREVNGQAVLPIAYPYQFITYELAGDRVRTFVEQGAGPRLQRIGPGDSMQVRQVGDAFVYSAPLFLDIPMGQARYQAFENYDFFIQAGGSVPNQLSWVRYGDAPAWAGGGAAIMHLVSWRVDRFADLPATIRDYVETDAPLWKAPPADLADIRRLQAAAPSTSGF